jgi:hypothetical protein
MADAAGTSQDKMFASVSALQAANDQKNKPLFSAGYYNHTTKKFEGGI